MQTIFRPNKSYLHQITKFHSSQFLTGLASTNIRFPDKQCGIDIKGAIFNTKKDDATVYKKIEQSIEQRNVYYKREHYRGGFTEEEVATGNDMVRRALSVSNSSTKELLQFRIKMAIKKFQKNPLDTASPALQCAILTEQLIHKVSAFDKNRQDKALKKEIQKLIHKRRKMLGYARMHDYNYYRWVLLEYDMPEEIELNAHHKNFHNFYTNKGLTGTNRNRRQKLQGL